MAHISDFWRSGGVLSAELWQGRHSTDEDGGRHSTHGCPQDATLLPHEDMPLTTWCQLSEDERCHATREWLSATRTMQRLTRRE